MNRRTFVQTLGAGAVGTFALDLTRPASAAQAPGGTAAAAAAATPIRIGSNENPYGPAASAIEAVRTSAVGANRYPGATVQALVTAVAQKHGVPEDHVLLSGGSGDILRAIVTAFTGPGKALVTGLPSYESPVRTAMAVGAPVKEVPLTSELRLDLTVMASQAGGAGLLYICNPNNPTATAVPGAAVTAAIESVLAASPNTYVLVDEAYFEYAELPGFATATPLVQKYPNVIVARTFSKIHGMAGMRVGYALANPRTLAAMRVHHSSSGMSVMSLVAARTSLLDTANMARQVMLNKTVRKKTVDAFERAGYRVAASDANFVFVDIRRDSRVFQDGCRLQGVNVGRAFPPLTNWARISIGTEPEMDSAIPVMLNVLRSQPTPTASIDLAALDALPTELT